MNGTVLTAILTAAFGAPLLYVLQQVFGRKKNRAEALAVEVANALAAVEPLKAVIETLTKQVNAQETRISQLSERGIAMAVKLDAAEEKVGILERREREFLAYRAEVLAYVQAVTSRYGDAIQPPRAPAALRAERTRRSDHEDI